MKALIFIEHDIMIRHFIHSGVFEDLSEHHDVKFVFPEKGSKRVSTDISALGLGDGYTRSNVHQKRLEYWTALFTADSLRWRPGKQNKVMRRFRRRSTGLKATLLYTFLALPVVYGIYRRWVLNRMAREPNTDLIRLLDQEKPDIILHPTVLAGVYINDLVAISRERNIPLVLLMNSWDNPSTKRAVIGRPDWLLVWGQQTKNHAMMFMDMPQDRVLSFGAAQFDVFRDQPRISRQDFCKDHDIDPQSVVLLYAGSSKGADEFNHLVTIDDAISAGKLGHATVVYRPHPWGGGGRDGSRLLDHPWVNIRIENSMRGYLESVRAGKTEMYLADYRHTHDVLSAIDILVSPLSTIIIEGALHGKAVLCYLPQEKQNAVHFQRVAPLIHFEDMYNMDEFLVARGSGEFIPCLQKLIERSRDESLASRLKDACGFFVETYDEPYGVRLTAFVESLCKDGAAAQE